MCLLLPSAELSLVATVGEFGESVDEISERYRLKHAIVVKLYHPVLNFPVTFLPRNIRLSRRRIATFSAHYDFLISAPYTYLLTY